MHKLTRFSLSVAGLAVAAGSLTAMSANAATYPRTVYTSGYSHSATAQTWTQETEWFYSAGNYNFVKRTEVRDNSGAGYDKSVTEWHPSPSSYRTDTVENRWTSKGKHTFSNIWKYYL